MITIIIIIIPATITISSGFTIYSTSWLQSWRLVLMDQVQRNLRRRNQDERKRSCSRGRDRRSSLSSFGWSGALQPLEPMPRLFLIPVNNFFNGSVDCKVEEDWSSWSECSATCRDGTRTRERKVVQEPKNGGAACQDREEEESCKTEPCESNFELNLILFQFKHSF